MKLNKRLDRLEGQFVTEPTRLRMPDGKIVRLPGSSDYLLNLFGVAMRPEEASPQQATHLDLIRQCTGSIEPRGSRFVELIQCFQHGPAKAPTEVSG